MTIEVYTTGPGCRKCRATKRRLENRNDVTIIDLTTDDEPAHLTQLLAPLRDAKTPIVAPIVIIRDGENITQWWTDYRPDKIAALTQ